MFEFFFKYPTTVFRRGEFVFASGWSTWLLLLAVLAAGAGLGWHLWRNPGRLEPRRLWPIGALELGTVALVLFLLWQPAISIESLRSQQNVVSVLIDTSQSMGLADDGRVRIDAAKAVLEDGLLQQLEEKFRVRLYGFSGSLDRRGTLEEVAADGGSATRIGESLASLLTESAAVPLGAVIVLSDGSDNSGSFDRRLMADIRQSRVPVHTVGIGRVEIPEDVELSDVTVPSRSLPKSMVNAQITIRHAGTRQQETRLSVRDGSRVLASKNITLRRGETVQTEWADFDAGDPGIRNLTFSLDPVQGEQILGNNTVSRVMDVPRGRRSVLYVEGEPRWEYKFMRRANQADESIRLVSMLRTTPNKFYRQGLEPGKTDELEEGFPQTAAELFAYDALIIGSIEAAFFNAQQQQWISDFVNLRGGTLLMLGGRRGLSDGGWGVSTVAQVLPVELPPASTEAFVRERAKVQLSVQGQDSLICRLDEDPERNQELWSELPEVADYHRLGDLKPAAIPLLHAVAGGETLPLLVTQNYGRGRSMILATGGTWRWKMGLPHEDTRHHTFWQQLLRSLATHTPGQVVISSARTLYADDPRVPLRAEVRTNEFQPANNATVTAVVTPEAGDPFTVELNPSPEEPNVYQTEFTAGPVGTYRAEVTARVGEETLGSDVFHFRREDGVAEAFHPQQNRELLTRLSEQTGGSYWSADDVAGLPAEVRFSEAGITATEILDLWDMPFLFFLLIAMRASEWLLRRKWGVI